MSVGNIPSSIEQTTQSATTSASVTAETDDAEPTSPGPQVLSDYTQVSDEPVRTSTQTPNSTETPASPTVQTTQSATVSASLAAETERLEPTSPGFQVLSGHTQETTGANQTTKPSSLSIRDNSTLAYSQSTGTVITNVMSAVVPGVIIILLIGIGSVFYRRRTRNLPLHTEDEVVPMNKIGS